MLSSILKKMNSLDFVYGECHVCKCEFTVALPLVNSNWSSGKMGIIERIKEIEAEMARTQKNKATGE